MEISSHNNFPQNFQQKLFAHCTNAKLFFNAFLIRKIFKFEKVETSKLGNVACPQGFSRCRGEINFDAVQINGYDMEIWSSSVRYGK